MDGVRKWFSERLGTAAFLDRLRAREVPSRSVPHYAGGVVVFLFLLQVASGILLMLPYRVDPAHAHESVEVIVGQVPFGSLIRGLHAWATHFFVLAMMTYLVSTLVLRRYRAPNELVWLVSLLIFVVGVAMAFTGIILPWNENGYLQARVSSEMLGNGPLFGGFVKRMLRGGDEITPWTLNHAFGFHSGVLPAAMTMLVLLFAVLQRRTPLEGPDAPARVPLHPDFVLRMAATCVGVMSLVVGFATFLPVPVGPAADLRAAVVSETAPPWYLLFVHDLLGAAPAYILGLESAKFILGALSLVALFVVGLPFVDRRGSRITIYVTLVFLALWGLLTAHAAL